MANATKARSDDASRNEELRPADAGSSMMTMAALFGRVDAIFTDADILASTRKWPAFRILQDAALDLLSNSNAAMFDLIPEDDGQDLMILAGFTASLADQLPDMVAKHDKSGRKLCEGIAQALTTISATLARRSPQAVDSVATLYPDLARSIRRDIMITDARRADMEGC
ncbi:hypothetical protein NUH86_15935 [Sphingobium sp. JS3065]|uniref:hypothetical protein n=1 Tax=Sphingobium sp. JS3065 TaxID=2970925 RepID=UPI002264E32F|nr:hypothetical protein [Sphingobium sp. JS3065]UZW54944.1 hypothetical protein NUH86_15935 [Sphingobium sp. JS3065]